MYYSKSCEISIRTFVRTQRHCNPVAAHKLLNSPFFIPSNFSYYLFPVLHDLMQKNFREAHIDADFPEKVGEFFPKLPLCKHFLSCAYIASRVPFNFVLLSQKFYLFTSPLILCSIAWLSDPSLPLLIAGHTLPCMFKLAFRYTGFLFFSFSFFFPSSSYDTRTRESSYRVLHVFAIFFGRDFKTLGRASSKYAFTTFSCSHTFSRL